MRSRFMDQISAEIKTGVEYWKDRALRMEIERDQFALEAKYNARDAARYRFIRSRWQFSDAEVDARVDADMAEESAQTVPDLDTNTGTARNAEMAFEAGAGGGTRTPDPRITNADSHPQSVAFATDSGRVDRDE